MCVCVFVYGFFRHFTLTSFACNLEGLSYIFLYEQGLRFRVQTCEHANLNILQSAKSRGSTPCALWTASPTTHFITLAVGAGVWFRALAVKHPLHWTLSWSPKLRHY